MNSELVCWILADGKDLEHAFVGVVFVEILELPRHHGERIGTSSDMQPYFSAIALRYRVAQRNSDFSGKPPYLAANSRSQPLE